MIPDDLIGGSSITFLETRNNRARESSRPSIFLVVGSFDVGYFRKAKMTKTVTKPTTTYMLPKSIVAQCLRTSFDTHTGHKDVEIESD